MSASSCSYVIYVHDTWHPFSKSSNTSGELSPSSSQNIQSHFKKILRLCDWESSDIVLYFMFISGCFFAEAHSILHVNLNAVIKSNFRCVIRIGVIKIDFAYMSIFTSSLLSCTRIVSFLWVQMVGILCIIKKRCEGSLLNSMISFSNWILTKIAFLRIKTIS